MPFDYALKWRQQKLVIDEAVRILEVAEVSGEKCPYCGNKVYFEEKETETGTVLEAARILHSKTCSLNDFLKKHGSSNIQARRERERQKKRAKEFAVKRTLKTKAKRYRP